MSLSDKGGAPLFASEYVGDGAYVFEPRIVVSFAPRVAPAPVRFGHPCTPEWRHVRSRQVSAQVVAGVRAPAAAAAACP